VNPQQAYFEKLSRISHPSSLKVAMVSYNSKLDSYTPGKRYPAEKFVKHDERNVAANEIVFDLDWKSYKANYLKAKLIIDVLNNRRIPHIICGTGGKGIHIHLWFNKIKLENEEDRKILREALKLQLSMKNIRLWLWGLILDEAGIEEKFKAKEVDPKVLQFNYLSGTSHLIRDIGGRKYVKNSEDEWVPRFKTYIPPEEFKVKKIVLSSIEQVKFPSELELMDIDSRELVGFLKDFIKSQKDSKVKTLSNERIKGKYIELAGVLKVREGLGEGARNSGATIIAIACRVDNMNKGDAYKIMEEYVANCSQAGTSFLPAEGKQWIDWIYSQEKPYWNCQLLKDVGAHDASTCEHCQAANKDAISLLNQKTLLKQISEVLDQEIVGENDTKVLIFLLLLSKNFPSKTGRPGWNIPNDPMAQNVILSSDSASGKSWIIKKILTLFGINNEDYFTISRITKNALNYYTETNMDDKIIFIEEMQGLDETTAQLRVWMSEGELTLDTVGKVLDDQGIENNDIIKKTTIGQPVFITSQAEGIIGEQLHNRSWVLSLDASAAQTKKILEFQDMQHTGKYKIDFEKKKNITDALKQLKPYHFKTHFADSAAMNIPTTDVRARRDYAKFITLVRCSAYLHQKQREIVTDDDGNEFIICDIEDYEIAVRYSEDILGSTFSGLTNNEIALISHLKKDSWDDTFSIADIMRNLGKSQPHWYGVLKQLEDFGYVTSERSVGNSTLYSLVQNKTINIINMPTGKELLKKIIKKKELKYIKNTSNNDEKPSSDLKSADGSLEYVKNSTDNGKKPSSEPAGNVITGEEQQTQVSTYRGTYKLQLIRIDETYKWLTKKLEILESAEIPLARSSLIGKKGSIDTDTGVSDVLVTTQTCERHYTHSESMIVGSERLDHLYVPLSPEKVLSFIKNHANLLVSFNDLKPLTDDIVLLDKLVKHLKTKGDIIEVKPSKYILG